MAKPKYSPETRLTVIGHYLSGNDGTGRTAERTDVERTSVGHRISAWRLHGIDGITRKNDRHSPAIRITVKTAKSRNILCWLKPSEYAEKPRGSPKKQ